jgi:hypothetical protein
MLCLLDPRFQDAFIDALKWLAGAGNPGDWNDALIASASEDVGYPMNYDDELRMRPSRLNGDVAGPNDHVVIWRGHRRPQPRSSPAHP